MTRKHSFLNMSLQIGQQLGSHEITTLLGRGGMREVYRARDTKLKREVAIKVLPDELSHDADRVRRFQREAGEMMAVAVTATAGPRPTFEPKTPQRLFEAHLVAGGLEYDVTSDGQRFLLNTIAGSSLSAPLLNVVLNWDAGLRK